MGFFDDVGSWISGAARDVYSTVLKPVGNGVVSLTNRVVNFGGDVADKGLNFLQKEGDAINDFSSTLSNPIFMIGALIVAAVVLPKLIK